MSIARIEPSENVYCLYILTNKQRSVLDVRTTGDWTGKMKELEYSLYKKDVPDDDCTVLLYWETFDDVLTAVRREEEIKNWSKRKKSSLIDKYNPEWKALNEEYQDKMF